jgi:hypothetical protein
MRLCKGRPRKPLAEVILWSAPLRATSSVLSNACVMPSVNDSKHSVLTFSRPVGIATRRKELLRLGEGKVWARALLKRAHRGMI